MDEFDETMKDIKENLIARINRQEQEIQDLKANLEMYENGVYFSSENDKLQERIDKAREKLKTLLPICIMPNNMLIHGTEKAKVIEETINILKGSDKE